MKQLGIAIAVTIVWEIMKACFTPFMRWFWRE